MRTLRTVLALLLAIPVSCGASLPEDEPAAPETAGVTSTDERRYELPAAQVWSAAVAAVAEDGATVESRRPASDGGEIVARRPEGHRMQLSVTAMEPHAARVVIAVTPPNATLAAMIQGRIGERLSLRKAQADLFGETSIETVYARSLEEAVAAAEETCRALELEITERTDQDDHVRIEARDRKSRPMRLSFRRIGEDGAETAVMFTVETARNGDADSPDGLRREFERRLLPARE